MKTLEAGGPNTDNYFLNHITQEAILTAMAFRMTSGFSFRKTTKDLEFLFFV